MVDHTEYWTVADLIRRGLFDSRDVIQRLVTQRRFPPPRKIAGRAMWRRKIVEDWFNNQSVMWIPRRNKS